MKRENAAGYWKGEGLGKLTQAILYFHNTKSIMRRRRRRREMYHKYNGGLGRYPES